jgi:hypothetical protein
MKFRLTQSVCGIIIFGQCWSLRETDWYGLLVIPQQTGLLILIAVAYRGKVTISITWYQDHKPAGILAQCKYNNDYERSLQRDIVSRELAAAVVTCVDVNV